MRKTRVGSTLLLIAVAACSLHPVAQASITVSFGPGAVTSVDRQATFDTLTVPGPAGMDLSSYTEGGLSITVPDSSHVGFDAFNEGPGTAFHYGYFGNFDYVTIRGTDSAVFTGLEFKIGDGFIGNDNTLVAYETYLNGTLTGSGNSIPVLRGSVLGFSDLSGFDELRIGGGDETAPTGTYNFGDFQALAIDDLRVQLAPGGVVPEPFSVAVWAGLACVGGVVAFRRRQR